MYLNRKHTTILIIGFIFSFVLVYLFVTKITDLIKPDPSYSETIQDILNSAIKNRTKPDTDIFDKDCIVLIMSGDKKTQVNMEKFDVYINRVAKNYVYNKVEVICPEEIIVSNGKIKQFNVIEEID